MVTAARTGHNVTSPDAIWAVVLFFSSFFCISKVMLMQLEYLREGLLWSTSHPDDLVLLRSCEGIKEDVLANSAGIETLGEAVPQPSLIPVCASRNCSFMGSFSSNKVNHELILLDSGTI